MDYIRRFGNPVRRLNSLEAIAHGGMVGFLEVGSEVGYGVELFCGLASKVIGVDMAFGTLTGAISRLI